MSNLTQTETPSAPTKAQLRTLRLSQIVRNPFQPRTVFDEMELLELATDIQEHGLMQPPLLRLSPGDWFVDKGRLSKREGFYVMNRNWLRPTKHGYGPDYINDSGEGVSFGEFYETREAAEATLPRYEIVDGERRVRSLRLVGFDELDFFVGEFTDKQMAERALAANAQRKDVSPLDEARAVARYIEQFGATQQDAADRCGLSRTRVANRLRWIKLPPPILQLLSDGKLSESHCVTLAGWRELGDEFLTLYAEEIIKRGYASKFIERGLMFEWEFAQMLEKEKIARPCHSHNTHFDVEAALKQYRAFHALQNRTIWCFNWDLWAQLEREGLEAQARADAERKEKLKALAQSGEKVIKIQSLKWGEYRVIGATGYNAAPPGCSPDCECRATGVNPDGEQVPICLQPAQMDKLRKAAQSAELAARAEKSHAFASCIARRLDEAVHISETPLTPVYALAAHRLLANCTEKSLEPVLKRRGLDFDAKAYFKHDTPLTERLDMLTTIESETLLAVATEALVMHEQRMSVEYESTLAPLSEWLDKQLDEMERGE